MGLCIDPDLRQAPAIDVQEVGTSPLCSRSTCYCVCEPPRVGLNQGRVLSFSSTPISSSMRMSNRLHSS